MSSTNPKNRKGSKAWRVPKERIKMTFKGKDGVVRPAFTIDPVTGCWPSNGPDTKNGYRRQSQTTAHRDAYRRLYDIEIPPGFEAHHLCENKECVNAGEHVVIVPIHDHHKIHNYLRKCRESRVATGEPDDCQE